MTLHHCFDAAFPPAAARKGCDSVLGYIGGAAARNVWTLEEWLRFEHLRQFPAWVPALTENPVVDGKHAAAAARARGWADNHTRAIICDTEIAVNRAWYAAWAREVRDQGYVAVDYGSLSDVLQNAAELLWVALWDDIPALQPGQSIEGDQYANDVPDGNTTLDLSVITEELYNLGGRGPRR